MIGFRTIYPLREGNKLVYSSFFVYEEQRKSTASFSIKYSHYGTEHYEVDGISYDVNEGEFLLISPNEPFYTRINASSEVKGLCIDLEHRIVSEVATALLSKEEQLLADPGILRSFLTLPGTCYKTKGGRLGACLRQLGTWLGNNELHIYSDELFYDLAEILLTQQLPFVHKANLLKVARPATQKELLRRLLVAKDLIEEEFVKNLDIKVCAKTACLSPFHFIRSFKQAFGITPHQYILQKRILFARKQLLHTSYTVNDIALLCGFANAPQFISLFKKHEGITPAQFRIRPASY